MNKRQFIRNITMSTGTLLLSPKLGMNIQPTKPPDILFIFANDQCHEVLSCFGTDVQTPNLDNLVTNSVTSL